MEKGMGKGVKSGIAGSKAATAQRARDYIMIGFGVYWLSEYGMDRGQSRW